MLLPKRVKYRRVHRGRLTGKAQRGNFVSNGEFGPRLLNPHGSLPTRSKLPVLL